GYMSRISQVFSGGHKALIAYITAGYPEIALTPEVAGVLARAGADIIELGIPFSDPLADGATIQKASYRALGNGVTPRLCMELARQIRLTMDTPLVFMSYYNPLLSYGLSAFCRDCRESGIDGLIVPDLPPEEGEELEKLAQAHNLDLIYMLAPTSTPERVDMVAARSHGFIYLVSLTGVTGTRQKLPAGLTDFVTKVRVKAEQPLAVGFGISNAAQAKHVAAVADGVIIGSRLIQLIDEDPALGSLGSFISEVRRALDSIRE
ncbi:MAG: tryptophan synthase subunit alpha, partial [Dehalococcoidales bacterium]|nr:tryptophan synthase subunit alpha [Dehalococcoidales bacterium]